MNYEAYEKFLRSKAHVAGSEGIQVDMDDLHPSLFGHQRVSVSWALKRGRALIASNFGMGKTRTAIEILRHVHEQTGQRVMIVCPLAVRSQFIQIDGVAMGVDIVYVRNEEEAQEADTPYLLTNYERVRNGEFSSDFLATIGGIVLDEGAILGNLGTKTQVAFCSILADIPYRWVATATPAPNDYRQLIYYAEFLGVNDAGLALTKYFGRNPDKAGDLQLLPHMEKEFWLWVASWCLLVNLPSDLGYDDVGYIMPALDVQWHRIASDHRLAWDLVDRDGQRFLLKDTAAGVQQAMKEKRDSLDERAIQALEIVDAIDADEQLVIWCNLNDEQKALERGLKERGITYSSIYGSLSPEDSEKRLFEWLNGKTRVFLSKPSMFGSGVNLQQAHQAIYVGVDFKFRDWIQSVHRIQRFGQNHPVTIHLIHTDAEDHVVDVLMEKWKKHDELVERMRAIVKKYGLTNEALASEMRRSIGVERQEVSGGWYTLVNNDCVLETLTMEDESVDEIVTSIPFGNHYEYVASLNDFGHNGTDEDFWKQMDFLLPELYRVLKPGRMACIHAKDRLLYGHQTEHGMMEVDYFTHDCARAFKRHGFVSYGEIFIPTDVVRENNSTNRLGWSECCKDGTKMGVGLSEKVLLFRKPQTDKSRSYADTPVKKKKKDYSRARWQVDAHSLWRSDGKSKESPSENAELLTQMDGSQIYNWYKEWSKENPYDYEQHVMFNEALGAKLPAKFMLMPPQAPEEYEDTVWTDILFFQTLNMKQARRRVEKHVCPLPMDIVKRLITRFSNEGELILDPFSGLGTVPTLAVEMNRSGYGVELNPTYWSASLKYCQDAEVERSTPTMFDLAELEVAA